MHIYSNTFLGTYKYLREKFYDYSHLKSIFHPYKMFVFHYFLLCTGGTSVDYPRWRLARPTSTT